MPCCSTPLEFCHYKPFSPIFFPLITINQYAFSADDRKGTQGCVSPNTISAAQVSLQHLPDVPCIVPASFSTCLLCSEEKKLNHTAL